MFSRLVDPGVVMHLDERQQREKEFWDKQYSTTAYSDWQEKPFEQWKANRPIRQTALDWLGPVAKKRVLLCGVGTEAVIFAQAGAEVYGFDISETQVEAVRALAGRFGLSDRIQVKAMPFEVMQYPDSHFDMAFGQAILHHVHLEQGAAELQRVLRPGGRASFIEPLGMNPLLTFARRHLPYREKHRTVDESPLTYREIEVLTKDFANSQYVEFSLLGMLQRRVVTNHSVAAFLRSCDRVILKQVPLLRRLCSTVWIGLEKSPTARSAARIPGR